MSLDLPSLALGLLAGVVIASALAALLIARTRAASADTQTANSQSFLMLAEQHLGKLQEAAKGDLDKRGQAVETIVAPVAKTLDALNLRIQELEKERAGAYGELKQQLASLTETHSALRGETGRLVQALRTPAGRGAWGEMQLERLLEMAGMHHNVHYQRQESFAGEDGALKPDIVVNLTGGKRLIIDAKTPMNAYLSAIEAVDDAARQGHLKIHAGHVRDQMKKLAAKEYWKLLPHTPEFVVMFMPSEGAAASALQHDADLIEFGMRANVVIATPMTLFALLRTIVYGWRQEKIAENAADIAKLGAELYQRIGKLSATYEDVGTHLMKAVKSYNTGINQIERNVLVTARKLREHDVTSAEALTAPAAVEESLRYFTKAEMLAVQAEEE